MAEQQALPFNMAIGYDEYVSSLKEMQNMSTDRIRKEIDTTEAFLKNALKEAEVEPGKRDLMKCTNIHGTTAEERAETFRKAHAHLSAAKDIGFKRLEEADIRNRSLPDLSDPSRTVGTLWNAVENLPDGINSILNNPAQHELQTNLRDLYPRQFRNGEIHEFGNVSLAGQPGDATAEIFQQPNAQGSVVNLQYSTRPHLYQNWFSMRSARNNNSITIPVIGTITDNSGVRAEGTVAGISQAGVKLETFTLRHVADSWEVSEEGLTQRDPAYADIVLNQILPEKLMRKIDSLFWTYLTTTGTGLDDSDIAVAANKPTNGIDDFYTAMDDMGEASDGIEVNFIGMAHNTWN